MRLRLVLLLLSLECQIPPSGCQNEKDVWGTALGPRQTHSHCLCEQANNAENDGFLSF